MIAPPASGSVRDRAGQFTEAFDVPAANDVTALTLNDTAQPVIIRSGGLSVLTSCWYTMRVPTVAVEPDEDTRQDRRHA